MQQSNRGKFLAVMWQVSNTVKSAPEISVTTTTTTTTLEARIAWGEVASFWLHSTVQNSRAMCVVACPSRNRIRQYMVSSIDPDIRQERR